jgi:hypothetical protein
MSLPEWIIVGVLLVPAVCCEALMFWIRYHPEPEVTPWIDAESHDALKAIGEGE